MASNNYVAIYHTKKYKWEVLINGANSRQLINGEKWKYSIAIHGIDRTFTKTVKNKTLTDAEFIVHSFCYDKLLESGIITQERYNEAIEHYKKYLFR